MPTFPVFPPTAGAGGPCNGTVHDQDFLLGLFDRIFPESYLVPIKVTPQSGYELFQTFAKIGERVSQAIEHLECGSLIIFSEGGSYATVDVELYRASASFGAVTVKAGSIVTTSRGARDFLTLEDASFGPLDVGPVTVPVRAIAQGWEWNVPGQVTTPRGEVLPGEIDTCKRLLQAKNAISVGAQASGAVALPANTGVAHFIVVTTSGGFAVIGELYYDDGTGVGTVTVLPALLGRSMLVTAALSGGAIELDVGGYLWGLTSTWEQDAEPTGGAFIDTTIQVRQLAAATGGRAPMLDGLGADRGLPRLLGEADDPYRLRIRTLPDTVSPGAIKRTVQRLLDPYSLTGDFIETWDVRYQTCWDADPSIPTGRGFDPNLFVYDDPRPLYGAGPGHPVPNGLPFYNRWLDDVEQRGAFIVVLPVIPSLIDVGMAYDDTGMTPTDFFSVVGGQRGYPAYDVPSSFSSGIGLQGGYDGFDVGRNAVYLGIWQTLQSIKAAGVAALVELRGN